MSVNTLALAVQHLLACGASHEAVVRFIDEAEASRKAKGTERVRKHRNACNVTDVTPPPLSPPMIYNSTPSIPSQNISIKSAKLLSEEPLFEGFWAVYPKKVGKGAARKAYRNALKRASHVEILAGAKAYAASKPDPQYTAHASTWLNADRWLDEPERKLGNVLYCGPWKEVKPEPEGPKVTEEERQANLAKLATIKFGAKKL
jgi:hypothetical protein